MPAYDCGSADCWECEKAFGPDRSAAIANYERREKHFALVERARRDHGAPPCRICLGVDKVGIYDSNNLFLAVCPECCETADHADGEHGHVWQYERAERGNVCTKCGIREHEDDGYISDRERI